MLKIHQLHKSYPIGDSSLHVLKGIDLNVEDGEMVPSWGPRVQENLLYSILLEC